MGTWLRLRADYDITGFSATNQIILTALKKHGMVVADNGSRWYLSGVPDERWSNDDLQRLGRVPGSAFDVIDVSSLQAGPNSYRVTSGPPVTTTLPPTTTSSTSTTTPPTTVPPTTVPTTTVPPTTVPPTTIPPTTIAPTTVPPTTTKPTTTVPPTTVPPTTVPPHHHETDHDDVDVEHDDHHHDHGGLDRQRRVRDRDGGMDAGVADRARPLDDAALGGVGRHPDPDGRMGEVTIDDTPDWVAYAGPFVHGRSVGPRRSRSRRGSRWSSAAPA